MGEDIEGVDTNKEKWQVNDVTPGKIDKWITPNWSGIDFSYEHHIYLTMPEHLISGKEYQVKTPHGEETFIFNEEDIFCESIKTNQSAYSALATVRYANFSIWLGTGGGKDIDGLLPAYEVIELKHKKKIGSGTLRKLGPNKNSGDTVYQIDLSEVPVGGPYKIVLKGYGSSHPFGVGGDFSDRLAYVQFRGLLHQRCGMEQKKPFFEHDIRETCHTVTYLTNSLPKEAKVDFSNADSTFETHGGYHDAGDADRRDHHMMAPIALLNAFDAFPEYFSDLQFNIPDQFDENYKPIGTGNEIPDIIDEAFWGTLIFEYLQEESGGVRSGTERNGYPSNDVGLDLDTAKYGTFKVSANSTTLAAGLFAHLARALKPYDKAKASDLQERAERAWKYAGDSAKAAHKLYFNIQYYLLTGDEKAHSWIKNNASIVNEYQDRYVDNPRSIQEGEIILGPHFFSYLVQNERPQDEAVVKVFEAAIKKTADKAIEELTNNPYPNGTDNPNRWWGSQTAQGQYADPCLMQWRLTKEQKYINAVSQLMDYNQGLNPIGKCYLTGIGFDRTWDPLHHDSYPMKAKGWGPAPGLQVFGAGNLSQIKNGAPGMIPDVKTLPAQRQFVDNRMYVSLTEFTIPESLSFPAVVYVILAEGGKWNKDKDPYKLSEKD
jgi:endoglucanase